MSVLHPSPFFIVLILQLAPRAVVLILKYNVLNLKLLLFALFINVIYVFYFSLLFMLMELLLLLLPCFCVLFVCVFSSLLVLAL
jgi:hypothetical protein